MKTLLLTICFLVTFNVSADIIETTNPALDTTFLDVGNSHWDTTTDLEWLDFSELVNGPMTLGHSLNSAEIAYDVDNGNWRLARYDEVTNLFNRFFLDFVGDSNGTMLLPEGDGQSTLIQSRNSWFLSFGTDAEEGFAPVTSENTVFRSMGLYLAEDLTVQMMGLKLFTDPDLETILYGPNYTTAGWDRNTWSDNMGVFMVRDYTPPVPIPAAIWLFGTGLIALLGIARRKSR